MLLVQGKALGRKKPLFEDFSVPPPATGDLTLRTLLGHVVRRELGAFKSEKHLKARLARLLKLPKAAAAAGLGMFKLLPNGTKLKEWNDGYALQNISQRTLGGDAGLRKKVLAALYPTFAKEIEHGFRAMERLPYTTG